MLLPVITSLSQPTNIMPGLESSENRVSPGLLSTANLVTPAGPVVEPRAVAAMADAFRSGLITTEDIIERASDLAKKRHKVELQLLNETGSPEATDARHLALQAASERAKQSIAQSQAATPLAQPAANLAQDQMEQQAALMKYPAAEFFTKFAPGMGLETPLTPDGKPDYAKMATVGAQLATWATEKSRAEDELKNIDTHVSADGTQLIPVTKQGTPVPVSHVKALQDRLKRPFQFLEPGQTTQPTQTAPTASAAPASPILPSGRQYSATGGTYTGPDAQAALDLYQRQPAAAAAPTISPRTPPTTPGIKPEIAPVGAPIGDVGFSLGSPKAKDMQDKAPTEAQQRAELALARFAQSNDMFKSLIEAGYDPTSIGSWMNSFLPEILKNGDRKTYDAAVDAWSQGLLRLESGAAISRQEKSWYERAFFPAVNDPPAVVEAKSALRRDVERMVGEIAQAGAVVSPESAAQVKRLYAQANDYAVGKPGAGSAGPAGQTGQTFQLSTGKKIQRGADGQLYEVR